MAGLKDYKRVIGAAQLFYLAGKSLKRQGVKYTMAATFIALAAMIHYQQKESKEFFDEKIAVRDRRLKDMAEFAKQIGEGNYTTSFDISDQNDALAQSLLIMRENLLSNLFGMR